MAVMRLFNRGLRVGDRIIEYSYQGHAPTHLDTTIIALDDDVATMDSGGRILLEGLPVTWVVERKTVEEVCRDIVRWL